MIEHSIKISDDSYRKIHKLALAEKRTLKAIIDIAVENYSKKPKRNWRI